MHVTASSPSSQITSSSSVVVDARSVEAGDWLLHTLLHQIAVAEPASQHRSQVAAYARLLLAASLVSLPDARSRAAFLNALELFVIAPPNSSSSFTSTDPATQSQEMTSPEEIESFKTKRKQAPIQQQQAPSDEHPSKKRLKRSSNASTPQIDAGCDSSWRSLLQLESSAPAPTVVNAAERSPALKKKSKSKQESRARAIAPTGSSHSSLTLKLRALEAFAFRTSQDFEYLSSSACGSFDDILLSNSVFSLKSTAADAGLHMLEFPVLLTQLLRSPARLTDFATAIGASLQRYLNVSRFSCESEGAAFEAQLFAATRLIRSHMMFVVGDSRDSAFSCGLEVLRLLCTLFSVCVDAASQASASFNKLSFSSSTSASSVAASTSGYSYTLRLQVVNVLLQPGLPSAASVSSDPDETSDSVPHDHRF
jgi:hypothetical protein